MELSRDEVRDIVFGYLDDQRAQRANPTRKAVRLYLESKHNYHCDRNLCKELIKEFCLDIY